MPNHRRACALAGMDFAEFTWHPIGETWKAAMAKPPIVVFDLDGTLADTAHDLVATLNVVLAIDGLPPLELAQARDLIGAGARPLIERGYAARGAALAPQRLEQLYVLFLDHYHRHIADHSRLFPGAVDALDTLESEGFRLAVCTNKLEAHALELLRMLGVLGRFAFVAGKDTFAAFKPDPRHLLETISRAGGDEKRAVMVGDSRADVDAAKAAGVPVVGVTFGYTSIPMRELDPDIAIDAFDALPAAVKALVGVRA